MSSTCWGFNLFLFFLVPKGRIWYLKNKTEKSLDPSHFLIAVNFPLSISFTYPTSSAKLHFDSHLLEKVFSFPWAVVFHSHISLVVLGPVLGFHNVCPTLSALFPLWPRGLWWHLCRFTNLFLVEYRVFRMFFSRPSWWKHEETIFSKIHYKKPIERLETKFTRARALHDWG